MISSPLKPTHQRIFVTILLALISPSKAILDNNSNGLSDVFEHLYNNGELFTPTNPEHLPTADPDSDGWSNLEESVAGTNPFNSSGPTGKTTVSITKGTQASTCILTWPIVAGKTYRLQVSTNLNTWTNVGNLIYAEKGESIHTVPLECTDPNANSSAVLTRVFWRIKVADRDEDLDQITTYEEWIIGTSPYNQDTDGDTKSDREEIAENTNPNNSTDFSARWERVTKILSYHFDEYEPPNNKGKLTKTALWNSALDTNEAITEKIPFTQLKARLETIPFPVSPSLTQVELGLTSGTGYSNLLVGPPCYHATLTHHRFWLHKPKAQPFSSRTHVLVVTKRTINGTALAPSASLEFVTMSENTTTSSPLDVKADLTQNFTGNSPQTEGVEIILHPLDVKEVWSDQISGVEANGFPDKTGPNEIPYIFMGATTGNTVKVKIKLATEVDASIRSQILFRWAPEGVVGELIPEDGTSTFSDGFTVNMSSTFNPGQGRSRYLIMGFDENKNGQLDFTETYKLIQMPHVKSKISTIIPCQFFPVAQADYNASKATLLGWASSTLVQGLYSDSVLHLTAFCNGTVPTYAGSEPTTIKRNEPGLTHPVGVAFTPTTNPGNSIKVLITKDHRLSKKLVESNALRSWLAGEFNSVADEVKADILDARKNGPPSQLLAYSFPAKVTSIGFGVIDADLLLCLGKVTLEKPNIDFNVDMFGHVGGVKISGLAIDLYDFDNAGQELLTYPSRTAAQLQAGFPSLGTGGKVFKTQIDMGGNNPYENPDVIPYTFFPY
jgi:hypothetical protein